jgi:hypothetical protein
MAVRHFSPTCLSLVTLSIKNSQVEGNFVKFFVLRAMASRLRQRTATGVSPPPQYARAPATLPPRLRAPAPPLAARLAGIEEGAVVADGGSVAGRHLCGDLMERS